jgi:hypothetical protein
MFVVDGGQPTKLESEYSLSRPQFACPLQPYDRRTMQLMSSRQEQAYQ